MTFTMRRLFAVVIAATMAMATLGAHMGSAQTPNRPDRGFDYWQPEWMVRELWGPGQMPKGMMVRLLRHTVYTQYGVPSAYAGEKSPVTGSPDTIAAGRALYDRACTSCHGTDGMGSGDQAKSLTPSPALLAYMIKRPISVDEYLLWAIADGGKPFDSEMPAFKDQLSRDEIWRIIAFMRAGFPAGSTK